MPELPGFSIVLPAYNEGRRIRETLLGIHAHLGGRWSCELLVIDDGSQDDTAAQVEALMRELPGLRLLRHRRNRGKGAAVRMGMLAARGEIRVFMDADLGIPVEEMDKLLPYAAEGFDCVIASKKLPGSRARQAQPFLRRFLGKGYSVLSSLLLVPGIHDFTCGMKLFTERAAKEVFPRQTIERWGFDTEILFLAHHLGFRIKEVPVVWTHQPSSKVQIALDVTRSFRDLTWILWNRLSGVYRRPPEAARPNP